MIPRFADEALSLIPLTDTVGFFCTVGCSFFFLTITHLCQAVGVPLSSESAIEYLMFVSEITFCML